MRLDQKIRQVNKPYMQAHEFANGYKDTEGVAKIGRWFIHAEMIKEWQPFYRTITGDNSTVFVLEIDIRNDTLFVEGLNINDVTKDELLIREIKLTAGLDFVRRFQKYHPDYKFFVRCSGQGYHLVQNCEEYIDPQRFMEVVRFLLHGKGFKEDGADFNKIFECGSRHGKIKYTAHIDKATFKYGLIRWTYSPYWKIKGHEFYSIPIKDEYTISDIIHRTVKENLDVEPYYIPPFEFTDYLAPEDEAHEPKIIQRRRKAKSLKVYRDEEIVIPATEDELRTHHYLKLQEMKNRLMGSWTEIAPAIRDAYIKVCTESGHYNLRILLSNALSHMGYTIEDIALFFRFNINDESDNINPEKLFQQLKYYFYDDYGNPAKFTFGCQALQDKDSRWYCCDVTKPCGRTFCFGKVFDIGLHTGDEEWNEIYDTAEFVLSDQSPNLVELAKTTRSGVTTSLIIKSAELNKRTVALFPTRKICDDTYPDAINIGLRREPPIRISGAVTRANMQGCLKLHEKLRDYPSLRHLSYISKPKCIGKSICRFWHQIFDIPLVIDGKILPIGAMESLVDDRCSLATIFQYPNQFDSIALTYAKMRMILETNKEENALLKDYIDNADVIILDEFSQFSGSNQLLSIRDMRVSWGKNKTSETEHDFNIFIHLQEELFILENLGFNQSIADSMAELLRRFIEAFELYFVPKFDPLNPETTGLAEITNPLSQRQRMKLTTDGKIYHHLLEKIARENSIVLKHTENVLQFLSNDTWIGTNITSEFAPVQMMFIAEPNNEKFAEWIREMGHKGTKVIATDATLPLLSTSSIFELDFKEENAGDPTKNNDKQLIIADSRKIGVTDLTKRYDLQMQLVGYLNKVAEVHGEEHVLIVTPNINSADMLAFYMRKGELKPMELTYFRSNLTIGVKSDKRIMVIVGAPFTPQGSHLAHAHFQINKFRHHKWLHGLTHKQKILRLSAELRMHAMAGAYYQTIGRAKDPRGRDRSVVYCWGMTREIIHEMLTRISKDTVVPVVYETYVRFDRGFHTYVGNNWLENGVYIEPIVGKVIDYIINYMKNYEEMTTRRLWKRLNAMSLYHIGYKQFHEILMKHQEEIKKYATINTNNGSQSFKIIKTAHQNI